MAGLEFIGKIPFGYVYIHGTVRDIKGKKMSKSLGNIIDPLDIIAEYGADSLRFSFGSLAGQGDLFLSKEKFEVARNFTNKIWNASRFLLMNKHLQGKGGGNLTLSQQWILSRFYSTLKEINKALENYMINNAANLLHSFFWHEFCDWYLEMAKQELNHPQAQYVSDEVLENFLKILHPFMPFISEEIWQRLKESRQDSLMIQSWPQVKESRIDKRVEQDMQLVCQIISLIRSLRRDLDMDSKQKLRAICVTKNPQHRQLLMDSRIYIQALSRLEGLSIETKSLKLRPCLNLLVDDIHILIHLEGVIDREKQLRRIKTQIEETQRRLEAKLKNLKNKDFLKKAPREILEKEKEKVEELKQRQLRLNQILEGL